mmetsp:Transcript_606/g.1529  ORF Transcript_606/g.1529 Transcript_606/m.1529 type:complete len:702 (-) Transcript_606:175-2280(-)
MEAAANRTLEEKAAEDRAKEEKAAENRAKDAARKREARQAGKADVHKSHGTTRIRRLREAEKALDEYTERSEERRAKDAYLEHLQGEVRAVFADDTKSCAYLSFRHAGAHLEGKWGLEKDQAQAKALFRQAASMGHSEAAYQLGLLLTEEGDWSTAFTAFEQASRPCNCWTKGSCATDAYKDPHFQSDHRQVFGAQLKVAEMCIKRAEEAPEGDESYHAKEGAHFVLASEYMTRYGAPQHVDKQSEDALHSFALNHIKSAASSGDRVAQTKLGIAYSEGGFGVKSDKAVAKGYFDKAASGTVHIVDPLEFCHEEFDRLLRGNEHRFDPETTPSTEFRSFCKWCRRPWCRQPKCGWWSGGGAKECGAMYRGSGSGNGPQHKIPRKGLQDTKWCWPMAPHNRAGESSHSGIIHDEWNCVCGDHDLHSHCGRFEQQVQMKDGGGTFSHREWYQMRVFESREEHYEEAKRELREAQEKQEMFRHDDVEAKKQERVRAEEQRYWYRIPRPDLRMFVLSVEHHEQKVEQLRLGLEENMRPNLTLKVEKPPVQATSHHCEADFCYGGGTRAAWNDLRRRDKRWDALHTPDDRLRGRYLLDEAHDLMDQEGWKGARAGVPEWMWLQADRHVVFKRDAESVVGKFYDEGSCYPLHTDLLVEAVHHDRCTGIDRSGQEIQRRSIKGIIREMCGSATHLRGRWLRMATCLSI